MMWIPLIVMFLSGAHSIYKHHKAIKRAETNLIEERFLLVFAKLNVPVYELRARNWINKMINHRRPPK